MISPDGVKRIFSIKQEHFSIAAFISCVIITIQSTPTFSKKFNLLRQKEFLCSQRTAKQKHYNLGFIWYEIMFFS